MDVPTCQDVTNEGDSDFIQVSARETKDNLSPPGNDAAQFVVFAASQHGLTFALPET